MWNFISVSHGACLYNVYGHKKCYVKKKRPVYLKQIDGSLELVSGFEPLTC